jgi:hypothetical protein
VPPRPLALARAFGAFRNPTQEQITLRDNKECLAGWLVTALSPVKGLHDNGALQVALQVLVVTRLCRYQT